MDAGQRWSVEGDRAQSIKNGSAKSIDSLVGISGALIHDRWRTDAKYSLLSSAETICERKSTVRSSVPWGRGDLFWTFSSVMCDLVRLTPLATAGPLE